MVSWSVGQLFCWLVVLMVEFRSEMNKHADNQATHMNNNSKKVSKNLIGKKHNQVSRR
jgi:hypothetical protein